MVGTDAHLAMRKVRFWLLSREAAGAGASAIDGLPRAQGRHGPRDLRYLAQELPRARLLPRYATIPPDNNVAEAGLAVLRAGKIELSLRRPRGIRHDDLAVLYTLAASCEKKGVNLDRVPHRRAHASADSPRPPDRGAAPAPLKAAVDPHGIVLAGSSPAKIGFCQASDPDVVTLCGSPPRAWHALARTRSSTRLAG